MINSWQTITRGSCVSKAWKLPSSRPILIYFEFRSKPSLIPVICMDPHSPNKLFATKYCFLILGDDSSFFFLIISLFFVFFLLFYVILLLFIFTKLFFYYYFVYQVFFLFFFMKIIVIFSCSGTVPECSVFLVLSTPGGKSVARLLNRFCKELKVTRYIVPSGTSYVQVI